MPRFLVLTLVLLLTAPPAAAAETVAERLAELRGRRLELAGELDGARARVARAEAEAAATRTALDRARRALEEARGRHVDRLEELATARDELRRTEGLLQDRIREMYVEGRLSGIELFLSLTSLDEVDRAVTYLARVAEQDVDLATELRVRRAEVERLEELALGAVRRAEGVVREAETAHREADRALSRAGTEAGALGAELSVLDDRIDRLTADWAEHRYLLAEQLVVEMGVTGTVRDATLRQASLRASLPLGPTSGIPPGLASTGIVLEGVASWYGPGFHGRTTSSGALFDERDHTAAHKTLPFGTLLLVTYRDRQVVVMINDRGPFIPGRELDLSRASAESLGLGLGRVTAEILVVAEP